MKCPQCGVENRIRTTCLFCEAPIIREAPQNVSPLDDLAMCDAYLDGLVLARDILYQLGKNEMLTVLDSRLKTRYGVCLFDLKSPVEND